MDFLRNHQSSKAGRSKTQEKPEISSVPTLFE
jgi:hypothetical protein